jgi:hypothetical protein
MKKMKKQNTAFTFHLYLFTLYSLCLSVLVVENQSKNINYAKQSQFPKKSNVYNRNFNNELQRKMDNGHLVKTNPNKANLARHSVWWVYPPLADSNRAKSNLV